MACISELKDSLNMYFCWNNARMTCFVNMLLALLATRTVNLNKVTYMDSSRTRAQRGRGMTWGVTQNDCFAE